MKIQLRSYTPDDWPALTDIILNAENFGSVFFESEKSKITVFAAHPDFGRVLVAEDDVNNQILGYASVMIEWKALVI